MLCSTSRVMIFIYDVITVLKQRVTTLWTACGLRCSPWFVILLHSLLHPWFSHWVWDKACSLFVSSLKSSFFCLFVFGWWGAFCCLFIPPPPYPHCLLTSSWDCQLLHKKLMRLLMVRNHLSILLSTYQIQCGDELKWQLWLRWVWSSPQWDCVAFSVRSPEWVPPPTPPLFPLLPSTLVSDYCHFTDLPSVPLAFWFLNPVIFILWSLRVCLAGWAACKHTHSHIYSLVVRRSYSLIAVRGSTDGCINWS